jgi:hypothetical protein
VATRGGTFGHLSLAQALACPEVRTAALAAPIVGAAERQTALPQNSSPVLVISTCAFIRVVSPRACILHILPASIHQKHCCCRRASHAAAICTRIVVFCRVKPSTIPSNSSATIRHRPTRHPISVPTPKKPTPVPTPTRNTFSNFPTAAKNKKPLKTYGRAKGDQYRINKGRSDSPVVFRRATRSSSKALAMPFSDFRERLGEALKPSVNLGLSYHDVYVTPEDIRCLKAEWLTDNNIAFWEEYGAPRAQPHTDLCPSNRLLGISNGRLSPVTLKRASSFSDLRWLSSS